MIRRRGGGIALLAITALALAGCSQIAAIAPVGGGRLAEVRYASIDVLTTAAVEILTAPVCAQAADGAVTCEGATVDGRPIRVAAPDATADAVTVTVGDETVYDGSIQAVLEKAMQG